MNSLIDSLNTQGSLVWEFARSMLWQSSLVIVLVLVIDQGLRNRVSAATRYVFALLILIKLLLPPSLSLPTSPAYWFKGEPVVLRTVTGELPQATTTVVHNEATPAAPVAAKPEPYVKLNAFGAGWLLALAGMAALLILVMARVFQIRRLIAHSLPGSSELQAVVADCAAQMQMKRTLDIRIVQQEMSPALCRVWKPVILLPEKLLTTLDAEQLRCVLFHELSHHRRRDVLVNWLQTLLQIAYWWHPLVWVANAHIRRVREQAVDEAVMVSLKQDTAAYPLTLLSVARQCLQRPLLTLGLVGIMESKSSLKERIDHLMAFSPARPTAFGWRGAISVLLLGVVLLPLASAQNKAANGLATPYDRFPLDVHFYEITESELAGLNLPKATMAKSGMEQWSLTSAQMQAVMAKAKATPRFHNLSVHDFVGSKFVGGKFRYVVDPMRTNGFGCTYHTINTNGYENLVTGAEMIFHTLLPDDSSKVFGPAYATTYQIFNFIPSKAKDNSRLTGDWQIGEKGKPVSLKITYPRDGGVIIAGPQNKQTKGRPIILLMSGFTRSEENTGAGWQPWSPEAVQTARNENKVVMVNFQADWDTASKLNLATSLETPRVRELMAAVGTALFKADRTYENAAIAAELKKFNRLGVPLTVIYPRDKRQAPMVLPELLTESIVTNALIKAGIFGPGVLIEARFITIPLNSDLLEQSHRFTGIVTAEESRALDERLKTQKGVTTLSSPRIATASGIQSSLSVGPTYTYVTAQGTTNRMTDGVTLEVIPTVDVETMRINLSVIASVKGFLGYTNKPVVMPLFKELSITNSATLLDGQVMILGSEPPAKDNAPIPKDSQLLVLVKVKLSDDVP
jgi:beta-lactamase regulating signal transducer with metallopeptidase domain